MRRSLSKYMYKADSIDAESIVRSKTFNCTCTDCPHTHTHTHTQHLVSHYDSIEHTLYSQVSNPITSS